MFMYWTVLIEKSENCKALCKCASDWNKEPQDFFFPGQLLQIKELVVFVLAQILLVKGKGEVLQNVCSLCQELEKIALNKTMY